MPHAHTRIPSHSIPRPIRPSAPPSADGSHRSTHQRQPVSSRSVAINAFPPASRRITARNPIALIGTDPAPTAPNKSHRPCAAPARAAPHPPHPPSRARGAASIDKRPRDTACRNNAAKNKNKKTQNTKTLKSKLTDHTPSQAPSGPDPTSPRTCHLYTALPSHTGGRSAAPRY